MTSKSVPGFRPSRNGLHFENRFEQAPVIKFDFPLVGEKGFGDASGGLCGGMVFAVRDFFDAQLLPPSSVDPPEPEAPLFDYLCSRLLTSFDLPEGVLKYYEWMTLADEDGLLRWGVTVGPLRQPS